MDRILYNYAVMPEFSLELGSGSEFGVEGLGVTRSAPLQRKSFLMYGMSWREMPTIQAPLLFLQQSGGLPACICHSTAARLQSSLCTAGA